MQQSRKKFQYFHMRWKKFVQGAENECDLLSRFMQIVVNNLEDLIVYSNLIQVIYGVTSLFDCWILTRVVKVSCLFLSISDGTVHFTVEGCKFELPFQTKVFPS